MDFLHVSKVYSFTYDAYGNAKTSRVGDSTLFTQSEATYTPSGNYMSSLKDASGNTVKYNYNETKGTLDSVIDPKQNTTSYTYDSNLDTLQSVSKKVGGVEVKNSYTYDNDKIKSITHNGFNYNFGYDSLGNNTTVSVGNQNLITNNYEPRTGKLLGSAYGNGTKVSQVYDNLDRVIEKVVNGETQFKYEYDANGNLAYKEDLVNRQSFRYIYDLSDRLTEIKDGDYSFAKYSYDDNNNISKVAVGGSTPYYSASYEYDKDDRNTKTTTFNGGTISNSYDALGRLASKAINGTAYNTSYNYKAGMNGATTTQLESVNNNGSKISYTYDANGNIETITEGTKVTKYTYNELNEVTREDNGTLNKSIVYSYDAGGNIVSKTEYPYSTGVLGTATSTISYSYGDANWKDKLTAYNGKAITYDAIGNPLTYDGNTFTWESGRQLSGVSIKNGHSVRYKYNDAGIRVSKTYDYAEGTTQYTLLGDKVIAEGNADGDDFKYNYDASGKLISMIFEKQEYFYVRNGQSDIIGLLDKTGKQVVGYTYDSWGKLLSTTGSLKDTLGRKNPYRYRGYRYDSDTGLYYLNSRYYNPEWGRFINADGIVTTPGELLSGNMFAYCENNPINRQDCSGCFWEFIDEMISNFVSALRTLRPALATGGACECEPGPGTILGAIILGTSIIGAGVYAGYKTATSKRHYSSTEGKKSNKNTSGLPNQGKVVGKVKGAPPVDAGKQGKHVPGHPNFNPKKTPWPDGETGVDLTQEGWLEGRPVDGNPNVRVWDAGRVIGPNGETRVNVKIAPSNGMIHGYPCF